MKSATLRPGIGDNRPTATLYYGQDVRETLRMLPEASVHMACTSPPYWGLRDYGADGQIGLEPTPDEFVAALVGVFREVKRVLRPDGTLWVNLGDSYLGGGRAGKNPEYQRRHKMFGKEIDGSTTGQFGVPMGVPDGFKAKDLVGIPWRVAFALQADGWYLRSDIIWHKPSCMPESVSDRPTRSHEYVFLFAHPDSGGRYFYDAEAVKEPVSAVQPPRRFGRKEYEAAQTDHGHRGAREVALSTGQGTDTNAGNHYGRVFGGHVTRNKRSVWTVNPKPYRGAHFAVWPPDLVRPMILAGTSAHGVCSTCGAPWKHDVAREGVRDMAPVREMPKTPLNIVRAGWRKAPAPTVLRDAWVPTCACVDAQTVPATVLDPFSGSATTGMVALQEGRNYIGADLNAEYLPLAEARVREEPPPAVGAEPSVDGDVLDLFGGTK